MKDHDTLPSAAAIDAITQLANAASGIDLMEVAVKGRGLPGQIPVGVRHGTAPELTSIRHLAEEWREHPERRAGTAEALTLDAFIDLTKRHALADTVIFADTNWRQPSLTAVIDYHAPADGTPGWARHRVHYAFPTSEQWSTWLDMNGKPMGQSDFAAFIEDNIADLSSPQDMEVTNYERLFSTKLATPSELVTLSRGLAVHVESRAKSAVTLQSGEGEIVWDEVHNDASGKRLTVPGLFMLDIPVFHGGETARVPVRLRYRVREGKVSWFYQIFRPDVVITERVETDFEAAMKATTLPGFIARPEA